MAGEGRPVGLDAKRQIIESGPIDQMANARTHGQYLVCLKHAVTFAARAPVAIVAAKAAGDASSCKDRRCGAACGEVSARRGLCSSALPRYDPVVLSTWKTYGTRGDVTKAREFYAKAHAGGIQEAKNRLDALESVRRFLR